MSIVNVVGFVAVPNYAMQGRIQEIAHPGAQ